MIISCWGWRGSDLAQMPYGERRDRVISAINGLGPGHDVEEPLGADLDFAKKVKEWQTEYGVSEEHAVLGCVLSERKNPTEETLQLLAAKGVESMAEGPADAWLSELVRRLRFPNC